VDRGKGWMPRAQHPLWAAWNFTKLCKILNWADEVDMSLRASLENISTSLRPCRITTTCNGFTERRLLVQGRSRRKVCEPPGDFLRVGLSENALLSRNFLFRQESELRVCDMHDHTKILSKLRLWEAIPLRLIVGYGFMAHGYSKLVHGPAHFATILHALGVPAPELMAWITILTEVVGGAAVLIGAFIPLVSIPMAVVLLTAMFTTQLPNGFLAIKLQAVTAAGVQFGAPGYEVDLLYLACLAALVLGGSGPLAISGLVRRRR
jgi:putative oxidoreductase